MAGTLRLHYGKYTPSPDELYTVSVGTLDNPATLICSSESDLIAYCQGHNACVNYEWVKSRYAQITSWINSQ